MPVDTKHQSYEDNCSIWQKCRDVVAGQEAIHTAGKLYLPMLSGQTDDEYDAYKARAMFYNATQRTVDAMSGLLFRKEPKIEVPAGMDEWLKNIDLNGNSLNTFVEKTADDVLTISRFGILVEHPI